MTQSSSHTLPSTTPLSPTNHQQSPISPTNPTKAATAQKIGMLEGAGLVGLGAMIGAGLRAGCGLLPLPKNDIPVGTLIVNLVGAFLLGLLYCILDGYEKQAIARHDISGSRRRMAWRLLCGTGVMGGLTTYSTFIIEVDSRFGQGRIELALFYAIGSILAGWLAVFCGDLLGRGILRLCKVTTNNATGNTTADEGGTR